MNNTTATPLQYGTPPADPTPKRPKFKIAVFVAVSLVICALAAGGAFLAYASKTYDVPLDDAQVFNDLNSLGFSSARYGDASVTPTDGFHLVSVVIGRQEALVDESTGLIDHITHEGATKKVNADITLENGYYNVVLPSTVIYCFQRGTWVVQSLSDAGAMVTPTSGIDTQKLTWDMIKPALLDAYPVAAAYYTSPSFTCQDEQGTTGGIVNVSFDQPVAGTIRNYAANAVFNTSYVDGVWKISCLSLSDDYAVVRYEAAIGTWNGTWQSTGSSNGNSCSKAQGTTPVLTVLSYDPGNNSLQATLSFSQHQHGMFRSSDSAAGTYTISTADSDGWVDAMPFQNLTLQADSSFSGGYSPSSTGASMVTVNGLLAADGSGSLVISCNFAVDKSMNVYDAIYDSQGHYVSAAPSYNDYYRLTKVA